MPNFKWPGVLYLVQNYQHCTRTKPGRVASSIYYEVKCVYPCIIVIGKYMKYSRYSDKEHELRSFVPSFDWLRPGDRVGLKKTVDGRVLVYYNSELLEYAFENVPDVSSDKTNILRFYLH